MPPSTPLSINGQHQSTVLCPPISLLSQMSASLNYHMAPNYLLLNQKSATLNCDIPPPPLSPPKVSITQLSYAPSTHFSINGQHHSTVICPLPTFLLNQISAPLNCHMSSLPPLLPQGSAPLNCHMPPLPPSPSKFSNTPLSNSAL